MGSPQTTRSRRFSSGLLLLLLVSCGPGQETASPDASPPPNPVEGLITGIEDDTLELRTDAGRSYRFEIADPTVPVQHLRVHQRDQLPVVITWRAEGANMLATAISDPA